MHLCSACSCCSVLLKLWPLCCCAVGLPAGPRNKRKTDMKASPDDFTLLALEIDGERLFRPLLSLPTGGAVQLRLLLILRSEQCIDRALPLRLRGARCARTAGGRWLRSSRHATWLRDDTPRAPAHSAPGAIDVSGLKLRTGVVRCHTGVVLHRERALSGVRNLCVGTSRVSGRDS